LCARKRNYEVLQVKKSSTLKTALVAVGGSLIAVPVAALELGDIKVHSTIGQPLRASIAYALGPNEALADTCVTLPHTMDANGLPALKGASMIVTDGVIAITGSSIVREPLMTMRINVSCPYTAQLTREYMMFIDPAGSNPTPIEAPVAARVASQPQLAPQRATPAPVAKRRPANIEPIAASRYQVQPGDSLSEVVQRIENRQVPLWPAVNTIFEANPDAFLNNDPNKLKVGSWLTIPNLGADTPATFATVSTPAATMEAVPTTIETVTDGTAYEPPAVAQTTDDVAANSSQRNDRNTRHNSRRSRDGIELAERTRRNHPAKQPGGPCRNPVVVMAWWRRYRDDFGLATFRPPLPQSCWFDSDCTGGTAATSVGWQHPAYRGNW
jgi:pilus assembly protein FimV